MPFTTLCGEFANSTCYLIDVRPERTKTVEEKLENWRGFVGLLVAALVGYVALSHWTLGGGILLGVLLSLLGALVVHFVVNIGAPVSVPSWLRVVILVAGVALMLWPQPGLSLFGYHVGDLLAAAGVALLLGLLPFIGWNLVNYVQVAVTLLVTSIIYGALVGYLLWATVAGLIAAVLLWFVVWLVQNVVGGTAPAVAG